MPTDEERREVARRLREKYKERSSQKSQHEELAVSALNYLEDIESCFPPYSDGFIAISDYIEPEPERTCHMVNGKCSKCGEKIDHPFLYCKWCGAKVVDE